VSLFFRNSSRDHQDGYTRATQFFMTKTYYEILGVDPNADSKVIRQAYLRASLKHHPDKNPDNIEESKALFIEVGEAYENLSDPVLREKYDRDLRSGVLSANTEQRASGTEQGAPKQSKYDSYRNKFDTHAKGMSAADKRKAMRLATMVGSALAGFIGSRMGGKGGGGKKGGAKGGGNKGSSILSSVASLAGKFNSKKR
jgi:curved DNA-binding protein CbpA